MVGDRDILSFLLARGADVGAKDIQERTALHWAAHSGWEAVVDVLVDHGADLASKDAIGLRPENLAQIAGHGTIAALLADRTPVSRKGMERFRSQLMATLVAAAANGSVTHMARLMDEENLEVNELNLDGRSALSAAAENGHLAAAKLLVERGGCVDTRDANGETALWWASRNGHTQVVELLLELKASTELGDPDNQTPLCAAAQKGHDAVVKALLENGGNPNAATEYGKTPLMFATILNRSEMVGLLIHHGAEIGYANGGETALFLANTTNHAKVADLLRPGAAINYIVNVQSKDRIRLDAALAEAAYWGHSSEITRLLRAGANPDGRSLEWIPLALAAQGGQRTAAQALISSGAEIDRRDQRGKTALVWAASLGHLGVVATLYRHGAFIDCLDDENRTALSHAAEKGQRHVVELLLGLGAQKETKDRNFKTPLWYAAAESHKGVVDVLLERGTAVECADSWGRTPLTMAVLAGDYELCDALLRKGAQMRTESYGNFSPLSLAALQGNEAIVELLIDRDADLNHASDYGQTPLTLAAAKGHAMAVRVLIEMGAEVHAKDSYGRTAQSRAKELGHEQVLSLLAQAGTLRSKKERALKKREHEDVEKRMQHQYALLPPGYIRVLELHPGKTGDVISFELHHVDLLRDHSFAFEALSYEWKGKVGTVPVQCNQERLLITPKCKAALESLCREDETRMLWIDAICVNQEDTEERSSQVKMMTQIYRIAKSVLMWLGEEKEHSELAFDSIPTFADIYNRYTGYRARAILFNAVGRPGDVADGWAELAARSYFQRAWIFQEMILAGSRGFVLCGCLSSPWDAFKAAFRGYEEAWLLKQKGSFSLIIENDKIFRNSGSLDIMVALGAMSRFGSTDARDKVFATLGLVGPAISRHIETDYTKTLREVLVQTNVSIINVTGHLIEWYYDGPRDTAKARHDGLPSWVVDFTHPSVYPRQPWEGGATFFGSVSGTPLATPTSLHVEGCILDKVVVTVAITNEKDTYDIVKPAVQAMSKLRRGISDAYPVVGDFRPRTAQDTGIITYDSESVAQDAKEVARDIERANVPEYKVEDGSTGSSSFTDSSVNDEGSEDEDEDQHDTNWDALLSTILKSYSRIRRERQDFFGYLAWRLSKDDEIPDDDISKHPPCYPEKRVAAWDVEAQDSNTFDLEVCKNMEEQHQVGYHLVYTEKGYLGVTREEVVGEDLVVALLGRARDLVVLRKCARGQDEWYERCTEVYLYGWNNRRIKSLE